MFKSYSSNLIQLLYNRGLHSPLEINNFLFPKLEQLDKSEMLINIDIATELIKSHILRRSKILIYGDYDCDGIGASSILYLALKKRDVDVDVFLPSREEDGYGLNVETLQRIIPKYNPALLITVDCGIQSHREVDYLKKLNIDVLITDHHEPGSILPDCIVVNPKLQNEVEAEFSGAGVAFMLIKSLFGFTEAKEYLDICAISTIADIVPLRGYNRIIVKEGLKLINNGITRPGILEIIKLATQNKDKEIDASDIAFKIAPRLNAAGRLTDANKAFRLLVSNNKSEICNLANELDAENRLRQNLCDKALAEAQDKLLFYDIANNPIIVLYDPQWESGIVGIVAAKLVEMFNRPTIILTKSSNGLIKGSGRSIIGVDLLDILNNNKKHLSNFGGHTMAAGLQLEEINLDKFVEDCNSYMRKTYHQDTFLPSIYYEFEMDINDISLSFANELKLLEPFGVGNKRPVFKSIINEFKTERIKNHPHIKRILSNQVEFVAFNKIYFKEILEASVEKNIYYTIDAKQFNKRIYASCIIQDVELVDFNIPREQLFYNYYSRILPKQNKYLVERKKNEPNDIFGELILVWSIEHFNIMTKKYPKYLKAYKKLSTRNPINTIVLSPDEDINFDYYSSLVVVDSPNAIKSINRQYYETTNIPLKYIELNDDKSMKLIITRDYVEQCYLFINAFSKNKNFSDFNEIYMYLHSKGLTMTFQEFIICIIILQEINAIFLQGGAITITEKCQRLESSEVYKFINDI